VGEGNGVVERSSGAHRKRDDSGASAVEYGLLVAAIAAVIVVVVFAVGQLTKRTYDETCESIRDGASAPFNATANCPP
jgi:pilus assembly protein Flp/PilA